MVLKMVDELSPDELKWVFEKAGLEGDYSEAEYIIRLTIYLKVQRNEDPFTFQFDITDEMKNSNHKDLEAENDVLENEPNSSPAGIAVVSSFWFADGDSARSSLVSLPTTFSSFVESHAERKNDNCKVEHSVVVNNTVEKKPYRNRNAGNAVVVSSAADVQARFFAVNLFLTLSSFASLFVDSPASIFMASSKHWEEVCVSLLQISRMACKPIWWPPDLDTKNGGLQRMVT